MKLYIVVAGQRPLPRGRLDAAAFAAAWEEALASFAPPETAHEIKLGGRRLLVSPRASAAQTAALLLPGAKAETEPMLDELSPAPAREGTAPVWLRLRRSARQKAGAARAEELYARLESEGRDCVLVTHPLFAAALLEAARKRGCVAQRSGLGALRPWERILLSKRTEHCGGCRHNCLLSDPGCPVGRDKAARKSA